MAHLYIRLYFDFSKHKKLSCAFIFMDIVKAFYSTLWQRCFVLNDTDASVAYVLKSLNLPPDAMHHLAEMLKTGTIMEQAGLPLHLQQLLAEMHSSSWFNVNLSRKHAKTERGTKPGDPLADIIFNFVMAKVLKMVRQLFADNDLSVLLPFWLPVDFS